MMLDIEQNGSQAQTKGNYEQLKKEFEEVEREHVKTAKKLEKAKLQLKAGQENQVLLFQDQEIKRKMILLTEINHQTELLEAECSSLEQDLNHQQHNMEEEENNVVGKDSSATQAEAVPVADSSTGSESVTSSRKFVPKVPSKMARMLHIHYNSKNDNI